MNFIPAHTVVQAPHSEPQNTAFFLHGVFGSKRNWLGFARQLVLRAPHWQLVLVDHRHHGHSQGAQPPNTLLACANDLNRLAEFLGSRPALICGHSFGGKVALEYAVQYPNRLEQVWVLDCPAGARPDRHKEGHPLDAVISAINAVQIPAPDRTTVVATLMEHGFNDATARWMTTNIVSTDAGLDWQFDLQAILELLDHYFERDLWDVVYNPPFGMDIHMVKGELSDRWRPEDQAQLERAPLVHHLPNAGHWVHVDNPSTLLEWLLSHME